MAKEKVASAPAAAADLKDAASNADANLPIIVGTETLPVLSVNGIEYEIANQVTRPVLQQEDNTPYYIRFDGPIFRSETTPAEKAKEAEGKDFKRPPHVAPIANLETGQLQTLVCNAILASEILEKYPNEKYVGLAFRIISKKIAKPGDNLKTIRLYDIVEIKLRG
jgi:hypothetical protein